MREHGPALRASLSTPPLIFAEGLAFGLCLGLAGLFGGFGGAFIYFQF